MATACEFRVCPTGCVHMTFGGTTTVHLTASDFAKFVAGIEHIVHKLADAKRSEPQVAASMKPAPAVDFH